MTFHIGQRIVCVDDGIRVTLVRRGRFWRLHREQLDHNLNRGDVYTVTGLQLVVDDISRKEFVLARLAEAWHFTDRTIGFPQFQFRPLIEKKTDISVFTKMLTPKVREREDLGT